MQLETIQDHRDFFKTLCVEWLEETKKNIADYPIQDSLEFATIILDCVAREPYEVTMDIDNLTQLESMQLVALAQISLADLPSIERLIKRSRNMRVKYRKRIDLSGWEEREIIKRLESEDIDLQ